jgi:Ca-activated chloride channel homolog
MFELTSPWALLLIMLPVFIWMLIPAVRPHANASLKIPFFKAMPDIIDQDKHKLVFKGSNMGLLCVIWILLVVALANPRWIGEPRALERDGHQVMLALDLSPSMAINDMVFQRRASTRLDVVKRAAIQFVQNRMNDKIGLILFGERAYLQTPLTYDHQTILLRMNEATPGLTGQSTAIGDALGLAVKRLKNMPNKGRVIILLTDGANNSGVLLPLKAAELAQQEGIKVYTIGLGSDPDQHTFNGLFLHMNSGDDLDEATLKSVATMTGGRYFRATDLRSLQAVYEAINQMETVSFEHATVRPQQDYYPWVLSVAYILLLYWLAKKGQLLKLLSQNRPKKGTVA